MSAEINDLQDILGPQVSRSTLEALLRDANDDVNQAVAIFFSQGPQSAEGNAIDSATAAAAGSLQQSGAFGLRQLRTLLGEELPEAEIKRLLREAGGSVERAVDLHFANAVEAAINPGAAPLPEPAGTAGLLLNGTAAYGASLAEPKPANIPSPYAARTTGPRSPRHFNRQNQGLVPAANHASRHPRLVVGVPAGQRQGGRRVATVARKTPRGSSPLPDRVDLVSSDSMDSEMDSDLDSDLDSDGGLLGLGRAESEDLAERQVAPARPQRPLTQWLLPPSRIHKFDPGVLLECKMRQAPLNLSQVALPLSQFRRPDGTLLCDKMDELPTDPVPPPMQPQPSKESAGASREILLGSIRLPFHPMWSDVRLLRRIVDEFNGGSESCAAQPAKSAPVVTMPNMTYSEYDHRPIYDRKRHLWPSASILASCHLRQEMKTR